MKVVRNNRRSNQEWTCEFRETGYVVYTRQRTKTNKIKTQHNTCWTLLCANKLK